MSGRSVARAAATVIALSLAGVSTVRANPLPVVHLAGAHAAVCKAAARLMKAYDEAEYFRRWRESFASVEWRGGVEGDSKLPLEFAVADLYNDGKLQTIARRNVGISSGYWDHIAILVDPTPATIRPGDEEAVDIPRIDVYGNVANLEAVTELPLPTGKYESVPFHDFRIWTHRGRTYGVLQDYLQPSAGSGRVASQTISVVEFVRGDAPAQVNQRLRSPLVVKKCAFATGLHR